MYGVDVNNEILEMCKKNLKRLNYNIRNFKLGVGNNLKIPFNKKFDAIVSINTIHYNYGNDIFKSINYLKSKIKKNGLLIIETPAPDHEVFKKSKICTRTEKFGNSQSFQFYQAICLNL